MKNPDNYSRLSRHQWYGIVIDTMPAGTPMPLSRVARRVGLRLKEARIILADLIKDGYVAVNAEGYRKIKDFHDNPNRAWHQSELDFTTKESANAPNNLYWLGRRRGEEYAMIQYRRRKNPIRKHHEQKSGFGLLGLVAAGVLGYWLWKNRTASIL